VKCRLYDIGVVIDKTLVVGAKHAGASPTTGTVEPSGSSRRRAST